MKKASQKNAAISNFIQFLKKTKINKFATTPDAFGFDFALPMLAEKAKNEFSESYGIVNNYVEKWFSDSARSNNPYSYLSEFMLTLSIENLNKIRHEEPGFKDE